MARRGNVRGKNVTTNTGYNASASGVFNIDDHFSAQLDNAWPSIEEVYETMEKIKSFEDSIDTQYLPEQLEQLKKQAELLNNAV